jgi:hypothetical protein
VDSWTVSGCAPRCARPDLIAGRDRPGPAGPRKSRTGREQALLPPILLATHSPILAALPGAQILQLDAEGIAEVTFDDSELVRAWRAFLDAPGRYLGHLG